MSDAKLLDGLSWRESSFVQHYANQDFQNGTQAVILAGYSPRTATATASRLLTRVNVQAALKTAQEARSARLVLTTDRTLLEAMRVAYGDVTTLFRRRHDGDLELKGFEELSADQRALVAGLEQETTITPGKPGEEPVVTVKLKVKVNDKMKAIELLMRHQNLLPTTARSVVVNNDNRSLSVTLQAVIAGLTTEELRSTLQALRGPQ